MESSESNNKSPDSTNKAIDKYIRRKMMRKVATLFAVVSLFVAFMGYALYKEYFSN